MNPRLRTGLIWAVLLATLLAVAAALDEDAVPMSEAELVRALEDDVVASWSYDPDGYVIVEVPGEGSYRIDGVAEETYDRLAAVPMDNSGAPLWATLATTVLPLVLLVAALVWFIRKRQQAGVASVLSLRGHTARQLAPGTEKTRFGDVGGSRATLVLPILGVPFGWAKPVPVEPLRFHARLDMRVGLLFVALAGPLSNLALALACAGVYRVAPHALLASVAQLNVLLALFNLLPIPPLDGSRVVEGLLPRALRPTWDAIASAGPFLLAGVILAPLWLGVDVFAGAMAVVEGWLGR